MVADIQLLQGKIIDDPENRTKNISKLIEELALEILAEEDLAGAAAVSANTTTSKESA